MSSYTYRPIHWSPSDKTLFLINKLDRLSVYRLQRKEDVSISSNIKVLPISSDKLAVELTLDHEVSQCRCYSWRSKVKTDEGEQFLLAAGLANGKIVFTGISETGKSNEWSNLIGQELAPRSNRACNDIAWHHDPSQYSLILHGLERHRQESCILVWDVQSPKLYTDRYASSLRSSSRNQSYAEFGMGDSVQALAWLPTESKAFVAGMNNKYLRIYDIRADSNTIQKQVSSKCVHGISIDPYNPYKFVSHVEDSHKELQSKICIWDTRAFDRPLLTLPETNSVVQCTWSPGRAGHLSVLYKDSQFLKLYDIEYASQDEEHPTYIERLVYPTNLEKNYLAGFAWHGADYDRLVYINSSGALGEYLVSPRIAINWSPNLNLTWSFGCELHDGKDMCSLLEEDISQTIKFRAKHGYGIQKDMKLNANFVDDNKSLKNLWLWLNEAKEMSLMSEPGEEIAGICSLIQKPMKSTEVQSELSFHAKMSLTKCVYHSQQRNKILHLCGWSYEGSQLELSSMIGNLEEDGAFEKAAAIAIFNRDLKMALQTLRNGFSLQQRSNSQLNLKMVSMALSGISESALWKSTCLECSSQLNDPYLKGMFSFLVSDQALDVINNSTMDIRDKVGFAAIYLDDQLLASFIEELSKALVQVGCLDGIFLTALNSDGLLLLEQFLAQKSDIQTVAALAIHCPPSVLSSSRIRLWIDGYRTLLDQWMLWFERAEFDVFRNSLHSTSTVAQQVYVRCNFCSSSVSVNKVSAAKSLVPQLSHQKIRMSSCHSCRKALPRCALCLVHMGSWSERTSDNGRVKNDWFCWCQSCKHGGHAVHLHEWFQSHNDCPVTGCECKCTRLDSVDAASSADILTS